MPSAIQDRFVNRTTYRKEDELSIGRTNEGD